MATETDPGARIAAGYESIAEQFYELAATPSGYSAAVSAYVDGECVLDVWAGDGISHDSLVPMFSSSKAGIGAVTALLVQRGLLDLDKPVSSYWPEFAAGGKQDVTVRILLSHQAGIPAVAGGYTVAELLQHTPLAERLAAQMPFWRPGKAHGYHAVTIGVLADELVRRVTGRTLSEYFAAEIRDTLGLEFYLGLLGDAASRVVDVVSSANPNRREPSALRLDAVPKDPSIEPLVNDPAVREAGPSALAGVASARGLARLYSAFLNPVDGVELFDPTTIESLAQLQSIGPDLTLGFLETSWAIAFLKPDDRLPFGSYRAFGHDGYGGALGMADPAYGLGFGYVTPCMSENGQVDQRALAITKRLRDLIGQR